MFNTSMRLTEGVCVRLSTSISDDAAKFSTFPKCFLLNQFSQTSQEMLRYVDIQNNKLSSKFTFMLHLDVASLIMCVFYSMMFIIVI